MPFYKKDEDIAKNLPLELQQVGVILPYVYLEGDSISTQERLFNFCVFHPNLNVEQAAQIYYQQKQYYEDTLVKFAQSQNQQAGKIIPVQDIYSRSNSKINGGALNGAHILVHWVNNSLEDSIKCTTQYYYNIQEKSFVWKNAYFFKKYLEKILYCPQWSELFNCLAFSLQQNDLFTIHVKQTINFLFKLYIQRLSEGWTLDLRDRAILECYFSNAYWSTYFYHSYQSETPENEYDLIQALGLFSRNQQRPTETIVNISISVQLPTEMIFDVLSEEQLTTEEDVEDMKSETTSHTSSTKNSVTETIIHEPTQELPLPSPIIPTQEQVNTPSTVKQKMIYTTAQKNKMFRDAHQLRFVHNQKIQEAIRNFELQKKLDEQKDAAIKETTTAQKEHSPKDQNNTLSNRNSGKKKTPKTSSPKNQKNQPTPPQVVNKKYETLQATFNFILKWIYQHPMTVFIGIIAILAVIPVRPTRLVNNCKPDLCLNHFQIVGGDAHLIDAQFLVFLENSYIPYNEHRVYSDCLSQFNTEQLLLPNVPLGYKVDCTQKECIGWDSISLQRALTEKFKVFDRAAFNHIVKVYKEYALKKDFNTLFVEFKNFRLNLYHQKETLEKLYGFTEKDVRTTINYQLFKEEDEYRTAIVMINHVEFLLTFKIKSTQDIYKMYQQYHREFSPKDDDYNPDEKELNSRSLAMYNAIKDLRPQHMKVVMIANPVVFQHCYQHFLAHDKTTDEEGKQSTALSNFIVLKKK